MFLGMHLYIYFSTNKFMQINIGWISDWMKLNDVGVHTRVCSCTHACVLFGNTCSCKNSFNYSLLLFYLSDISRTSTRGTHKCWLFFWKKNCTCYFILNQKKVKSKMCLRIIQQMDESILIKKNQFVKKLFQQNASGPLDTHSPLPQCAPQK